ncbi:MAG TPA: hypothetical protein VFB10_13700 [Candidatus Dormibacteraeota bacterium]|nr:hypothetical protein [Candidatus Dormibacteraeota bacterium]
MPDITDAELIIKLLQATDDGRIVWEKGEMPEQFTAKYAGKWSLTIDKSADPDNPYFHYWLSLSNAGGEEILRVYSSDEEQLDRLFELAKRRALKVDEALSDLLKVIETHNGGQKDEDIPF